MLFVCHSSLDRETIVKPLLYHLYEFGIDIWYDHKKLFLSDSIPIDVYEKGIIECSDILIVYSKNLVNNSICGRDELNIVYKNMDDKTIYPVMYQSALEDYKDNDYNIIHDLIHYKINESNLYQVAVQIAIGMMRKILNRYPYGDKALSAIYRLVPPFNLREKVVALLTSIYTHNPNNLNREITELNINSLLSYYQSLIKLNTSITENDVKLLELLTIMIASC